MTPQQREQILAALWPEGGNSRLGVWAVLDCARDPKIYLALLESRLEFRCLYSGRLPQALERAAPHLVELLPSNRLVHRWLDEAWGQSWGVFLKIGDPSNLRHHLRKLLRVRSERGDYMLMRWYDPRVLGLLLRSFDAQQLRSMFGEIHAFAAEAAHGEALSQFTLNQGRLREDTLRWADQDAAV